MGESDTDSIVGISEQGDGAEVIDATPAEVPVAFIPRATQYSDAFASLDAVSLRDVFDSRAFVMQSVPFFLRGAFRGAIRVSLQAILRMGSHTTREVGKSPRLKALEERFRLFQQGRWLELLAFCRETERQVHQSSVRRRRGQRQDHGIQRRVDRAHNLVQGELSAARQALEGANVAPGTMATLRELTNPARRPPVARHALSQEILRSEPVEALQLDGRIFSRV